jgi:drug/metabolite transporter (DMT)-like permease
MRRPDATATGFVLVWSSGYVVGSIASRIAAPLAIVTWRLGIACLVLAGLAAMAGARWPRGRVLARTAAVGVVIFGIQFGFMYLALGQGMPAGTAAMLMSICPLAVAVLAATLRLERLGPWQWTGVALGVAGVVLALADRVSAPPSIVPVLWSVLGLAGFAVGTLLQRRLPADLDFRVLGSVECGAAALVMIPWALLHGGLAVPVSPMSLFSAGWLTLVCAVGGPLLLFSLIRRRGATRASSLLFLVPAVTALVSWPALGQPFGPDTIGGLVLAGAGVWLLGRRIAGRSPAAGPAVPARGTSRPAGLEGGRVAGTASPAPSRP